MLHAATQADTTFCGKVAFPPRVLAIVGAVLRYQSEHVPLPRDEQELNQLPLQRHEAIREWVAHMYDAPEPEPFKEIEDLLQCAAGTHRVSDYQDYVMEAFRRGQKYLFLKPGQTNPLESVIFEESEHPTIGRINQAVMQAYRIGLELGESGE
jgi:hypothetical protein